MAVPSPLLKLNSVSKRFDSPEAGTAGSLTILDGISLEVQSGESLAIVGPSGSGKSTLLHIIGTLDRPTSGQVLLDGQDLSQLDDQQLAAVRNRRIGFVFQAHFLLPQCTVLENVLVPTLAKTAVRPSSGGAGNAISKAPGNSGTEDYGVIAAPDEGRTPPPRTEEPSEARARRLLERVGLGARISHVPGQLSGGERQRVAVVRALINRPGLLLADEPTGALDHASAHSLGRLLVELNREEGVTLIVVTHASDLARLMKRVCELSDGRLKNSAGA